MGFSSSPAVDTKLTRIIGNVQGQRIGPTVIFIAGLHGNEPAGVKALQYIFPILQTRKNTLAGSVIGIAGNLAALDRNVRYLNKDLNRLWEKDYIESLLKDETVKDSEEYELTQVHQILMEILNKASPPFYIIDLHTTSAPTCPFILINDSLLNRAFVSQYSYPIILGIEENLGTTLLSFFNDMGYVSFGFESGQHKDPTAIENAIVFIDQTLQLTTSLSNGVSLNPDRTQTMGEENCLSTGFFEIYYMYRIEKNEHFKMLPGFNNFEHVPAGVTLAKSDVGAISTKKNIQLFLPLYQKKGTSGYYFIRKIPRLFLKLSQWLRQSRSDRILVILPGVKWGSENRDTLLVNLKIARFMARPIFHLLGYRTRSINGNQLILRNRERGARESDYANQPWY